jgi:hypothetical protein
MGNATRLAIVLACALAGCQRSVAMDVCRKAEQAGVLKNCKQSISAKDGATEMVEANDAQLDGLARVFISTYASDKWYEDDLRKKEHKRPLCLHGNPKRRIIVTADERGFAAVCQGVYAIVDADR